jgi:hypothetical protein
MNELIENIYGLLGIALLLWSTVSAFRVSKPLAVGIFCIWPLFFPYFAFKYWEEAKGPINLFLFIFLSSLFLFGLEYVGAIS